MVLSPNRFANAVTHIQGATLVLLVFMAVVALLCAACLFVHILFWIDEWVADRRFRREFPRLAGRYEREMKK